MRREGRPHGMVRTYHVLAAPLNPRPPSRVVNALEFPPTAGLFTKVSNKPTNHSKFTGKCEKVRCSGCHLHPACKAKDKAKGSQKLKTSDAAVNYQQVNWRVVGSNNLRKYGNSASDILNELNIGYHHQQYLIDDDDENLYHDDDDEPELEDLVSYDKRQEILIESDHEDNAVNDDDGVKDKEEDDLIIHAGVTEDGDDGYMGFYDVAYVLSPSDDEDEEGWSVVGGQI